MGGTESRGGAVRALRAVTLAVAALSVAPCAAAFGVSMPCAWVTTQSLFRPGGVGRAGGARGAALSLGSALSRDSEAVVGKKRAPTPDWHDDDEGAKFRRVCDWMREGGGWVGPVSVGMTPWGGRDLVATRDVRAGEVLLYVPRKMQLFYQYNDGTELGAAFVQSGSGVRSEGMLEILQKIPSDIWAMQLAMVLCREVLLHRDAKRNGGPGSRFGPYLDALPGSYGGLPMNLRKDDVKMLQVPAMVRGAHMRQDFVDFFKETVLDMLPGTAADPFGGHEVDRELIMWALATTGTRAFRARSPNPAITSEPTQGGHLASLFPIVDMINHDNDPSVEIWENRDNDRTGASDRLEYGIKAIRDISAGEALRISYGDELDNQKLMMDYGFVLAGNEHASVKVSMNSVHAAVRSAVELFPDIFDDEMQSTRKERDQMREAKLMKLDFIRSRSGDEETVVTINSDGTFDARSWAVARVLSAESLAEVEALGDPFSQGSVSNEEKAQAVLQRVCQQELDKLPTTWEQDEVFLASLEAEPEGGTVREQENRDSKMAAVRFRMDHKHVVNMGKAQIEREMFEEVSEMSEEAHE